MPQMLERVRVTDSIRELMAEVVARLDSADEDAFLDADDAVQVEDAYGGRKGRDEFRFVYLQDDATRWVITLRERDVRDVADGQLEILLAKREIVGVSKAARASGDALLVWGDGPIDALSVQDPEHVRVVLAALAADTSQPRWFRLWSRSDDLMSGVVTGGECSLRVVWSSGRYATSRGNDEQTEEFDAPNGKGSVTRIPWSECVDWSLAIETAVEFAISGKLGGLPVKEQIDGDLLARALGGRGEELASRPAPPPLHPAASSLGQGSSP